MRRRREESGRSGLGRSGGGYYDRDRAEFHSVPRADFFNPMNSDYERRSRDHSPRHDSFYDDYARGVPPARYSRPSGRSRYEPSSPYFDFSYDPWGERDDELSDAFDQYLYYDPYGRGRFDR